MGSATVATTDNDDAGVVIDRSGGISVTEAIRTTNTDTYTVMLGGQHFAAELADGFPAHHHQLTLIPAVALALAPARRGYTLLWSLAPCPDQPQPAPWQLSLAGRRQEQNTATSPVDHPLKLCFSLLFRREGVTTPSLGNAPHSPCKGFPRDNG